MSISMNKVLIAGNVTREPELRFISTGTAVCEIGLAVNDRRKGKDGSWTEDVTFVTVTVWGKTAETANEYVHKGTNILVEGRLTLDQWEKDGNKHSLLKVTGDRIQFASPRQQPQNSDPYHQPSPPHEGVDEPNNPF